MTWRRVLALTIGALLGCSLVYGAILAWVHDDAFAPRLMNHGPYVARDGLHISVADDTRVTVRDGGLPVFQGTVTPSSSQTPQPLPSGYVPRQPLFEARSAAGGRHVEGGYVGIGADLLNLSANPATSDYTRSTRIVAGYRSLRIVSEVRLPADDLWLRALIDGSIDAEAMQRHLSPVQLGAPDGGTFVMCCGSLRYAWNRSGAVMHLEESGPSYDNLLSLTGGRLILVRNPLLLRVRDALVLAPDTALIETSGYRREPLDAQFLTAGTEQWLFLQWPSAASPQRQSLRLSYPPPTALAASMNWLNAEASNVPAVLMQALAAILRASSLGVWIVVAAMLRGPARPSRSVRVASLIALGLLPSFVELVVSFAERIVVVSMYRFVPTDATNAALAVLALLLSIAVVAMLGRSADELGAPVRFVMQFVALSVTAVAIAILRRQLTSHEEWRVLSDLYAPICIAVFALVAAVLFLPALRSGPYAMPSSWRWAIVPIALGAGVLSARAPMPQETAGPWLVLEAMFAFTPLAYAIAAWQLAMRGRLVPRIIRGSRWGVASFLAIAVGAIYPTVGGMPVTLLFAVPGMWLLLRPIDPLPNGGRPPVSRIRLFAAALRKLDYDRAQRALFDLSERVYDLQADVEKDDARAKRLRERLDQTRSYRRFAGLDPEILALGGPMFDAPRKGAKAGFLIGSTVAILLLLHNPRALAGVAATSAPVLAVMATVLESASVQGIAGAAFGLVLHRLVGRMALIKAFLFVLVLALAKAPAYVLAGVQAQIVPDALRDMLVFGSIGAVADLWVFLRVGRHWFSTARIVNLAGLGAYTAVVTILIGSVGAAASGMLSDTVTQAIKHLAAPTVATTPATSSAP